MWSKEAERLFYEKGMKASAIADKVNKNKSTVVRTLKKDEERYNKEKERRKQINQVARKEKKRKWWQDNRGGSDDLTAKELSLIQRRDAMLLSRDLAPKGRALYPEMAYHQSAYEYDPKKGIYKRRLKTVDGALIPLTLPRNVCPQSSGTASDFIKRNQLKHT